MAADRKQNGEACCHGNKDKILLSTRYCEYMVKERGLMKGGGRFGQRYHEVKSSFWEYQGELSDSDLVNLLVQT